MNSSQTSQLLLLIKDRMRLTLLTSSRAASPLCLLRQARMTLAPLLAKSMAVVFPMPVLLPGGKKYKM